MDDKFFKPRIVGPEDCKLACTLECIQGGKSLRTNKITGHTDKVPGIGEQIVMWGEGLDFGFRRVNTSPIVKIESQGNKHACTTESGSIYLLVVDA